MDRILILMSAVDFLDAQTALYSAKENASDASRLSYGVVLENEPDDESQSLMAALGHIQFLCPENDAWRSMPELWQGEGHVLMAHPAMRFTKGWDQALLQELRKCPDTAKGQNALTGCLPVREDPLDAVCPVGADAFNLDGLLTFRHGTPLKYTSGVERGPFLHPDFVFAPAGFFRTMAEVDDAPLFLRAFAAGWNLYALSKPVIRLVWDLPIAPCWVDPSHPLCEDFQQVFGVDYRTGSLSPQSRRGMINVELNFAMKMPLSVKIQEQFQLWQQQRMQHRKQAIHPLCVTLYTQGMPEETLRWLKRLADLKHLPLLAYADPLLLRKITDFLPNVMEFKARYMMDLPVDAPHHIQALSKASILAKARDREVCTDKIMIAMVNGIPDPTMFVVPDAQVLTLAREMEARCLTYLNQRGDLPTETELWQIIIREHPEWFQLIVMPVERQLFTRLTTDVD